MEQMKLFYKDITKEDIKEWIEDEWEELYHIAGSNRGEVTSIIKDVFYKWMKKSLDNKLFIYKTLIEYNSRYTDNKNDEVIEYLNLEIKALLKNNN